MEPSSKQLDVRNASHEADTILAEIDNLIATTEALIEGQRKYVRSVASDFEGSMKAVADLDTMTSALQTLTTRRALIVRRQQENHWQAAALRFGWD
jgi:phosphoglycerate-specific signal transduction histidine kinase